MTKLTKKMQEVLKSADLANGKINKVPMSTMLLPCVARPARKSSS